MKNKGNIVEKHFIIDDSFKDPLDPISAFEEIEVEEFKHYYGIHLGVPIGNDDDDDIGTRINEAAAEIDLLNNK